MKKILLLAAFITGFTAVQADDLSVCDRHENMESSFYSVELVTNNNGVPTLKSGKAMRVCREADTIYIHNPFCSAESVGAQAFIKGTIDEAGEVTFALDQVTYTYLDPEDPEAELRYWKLGMCYFREEVVNGCTNYRLEPLENRTEYKMKIDSKTGVIKSVPVDLYICEYEDLGDGERRYQFSFGANYVMTPYVPETIVVPEEAQYERYIYTYLLDGDEKVKVIDVAFHEDDMYVEGMLIDDAWMVGQITDSIVTFNTKQKLGIYSEQFVEYVSGQFLGVNVVTGAEEYDYADALVLNISEDKKELSFVNDSIVLMLTNGTNLLRVVKNPGLEYFNEVPATPSAPVFKDGNIDATWAGLEFYIHPKDVDGNFINPEFITYSVFLDDELYEFIPGLYNVMEPISEMPYGFCDLLGFDLYADGDLHRVFFYGELFETISAEVYYTVKGERRTSERLVFGGNSVKAIENSKVVVESYYIDLNGRRVEQPQNGIYIKAEKYEDGSIQHTKALVRTR